MEFMDRLKKIFKVIVEGIMKGKKIFIILAVVVVMGILVVAAIKNKPQAEETIGGDKAGIRVQVEKVKTDNIQTKISSSGKLEAVDTQTVYLDTSNKVISVKKEVGDAVQKGDVILTLDKEAKLSNEKSLQVLEAQLAVANEALNNLLGESEKGDVLKAKQAIATLENSKKKLENSITQTKIKIETLERNLATAEKQLKVDKELLVEGLISQDAIDKEKDAIEDIKKNITENRDSIAVSQGEIETLNLQMTTAQYDLDVLLNKEASKTKEEAISAKKAEITNYQKQIYDVKTSLNKATTTIVAPIDGVITDLPVEDGMSVSAGATLFTIVDPSKLKVECDISPYYAPDLKVGLEAIVKYTGSKTIEVEGEVTKVAAVATVKTTTSGETISLPVDVEIKEPGGIIKPGFSVDVKLITNTRENVCVVPLLAVLEEEENEYYVYIVKEDGSLEKRTVTQGLSNGLYIEVEGVNEGEMIVSNPSDTLTEDTKVSYEKGDM